MKRPDRSPDSSPPPKRSRLPSPISPGTVTTLTKAAIEQEVRMLQQIRNKMVGITPSRAKTRLLIEIMTRPNHLASDSPPISRLKKLYRALRKRALDFQKALILSGEESPTFTLILGPEQLHRLDKIFDGDDRKMNRLINLYVNLLYQEQTHKIPPLLTLRVSPTPMPGYLQKPLAPDHVLRGILAIGTTTFIYDQRLSLPICSTEDLAAVFTPLRRQALSEFLFNNTDQQFELRKKEQSIEIDDLVPPNPKLHFHPGLQKAYRMSRTGLDKLHVSEIPIYFVLTSKSLKHAMISILFENRSYSVGYGYNGHLVKFTPKELESENFLHRLHARHLHERGALYTPDFLLNLFHPRLYDYKVVDFGLLTKEHMDRIRSFFDKVERIDLNVGKKTTLENKTVLYKQNDLDGSAILSLNQTYSELCFKNTTRTMNCAGFVNTIFAPRIDCNYALGVVHPTHCRKTDGSVIQKADMDALQSAWKQNDTKKLLALLDTPIASS